MSSALKQSYRRNDGHVDEASLQFSSSFWMNMLSYCTRITTVEDILDTEILCQIHTYLDDVIDLLSTSSPALAQLLAAYPLVVSDGPPAARLRDRLVQYYEIFTHRWNMFVQRSIQSVGAHQACGLANPSDEPAPKRLCLDQ